MKNRKKEMRLFSIFDYDGMAKHFEEMAAKGWLLEKITRGRFVYIKSQPKNIKYAVTYYADRSDFDPGITEGQMDLNEFCRMAGWQFIGSIAQMHIYCNERENPLPLETDPKTQVENVHRAMKRNYIPSSVLLIVLSLLIISIHTAGIFTNPTYRLTDSTPFFTVVIYLTLIALVGRDLITYCKWKIKATRAAAEGYRIPSAKSDIRFQIGMLIWVIMIAAAYIMVMMTEIQPIFLTAVYAAVGGSMAVTLLSKELLKKLNVSRNTNRIISLTLPFVWTFCAVGLLTSYIIKNHTDIRVDSPQPVETYRYLNIEWEIYKENIPLKIEHFYTGGNTDSSVYSYEKQSKEGFFAQKHEYRQTARRDIQQDLPDIRYDVYETKFRWAYNLMFDDLYNELHLPYDDVPEEYQHRLKEENRAEWGALKVYKEYEMEYPTGTYLLCFEDKIVEFRYYEELTPRQKKIIGDRLQFVFTGF